MCRKTLFLIFALVGFSLLINVANAPKAVDANGDGEINIADLVYVFAYLFLEGAPPQPHK
jgi:hypothetical protein